MARGKVAKILPLIALCAFVLLWSTPFFWMLVAAFRPSGDPAPIASLWPGFVPSWEHFSQALQAGHFLQWYANTLIVVSGILLVQLVTVSLAGYVFARVKFRGRDVLFALFLLQLLLLPPVLLVPNLKTIVHVGLYGTLGGMMAPYFASAFGVFLMRQVFQAIPSELEQAAIVDGASWWQVLWHILLPLARPGLVAFSIVSVVFHWNEFLWPLVVINSPEHYTLTVGLSSFATGAEGGSQWGMIAAGTLLVIAPLIVLFVIFQRHFVDSFMYSGMKS